MGKGDKRSRRGKIFAGSYGKTRKHKTEKSAAQLKAEGLAAKSKAKK